MVPPNRNHNPNAITADPASWKINSRELTMEGEYIHRLESRPQAWDAQAWGISPCRDYIAYFMSYQERNQA